MTPGARKICFLFLCSFIKIRHCQSHSPENMNYAILSGLHEYSTPLGGNTQYIYPNSITNNALPLKQQDDLKLTPTPLALETTSCQDLRPWSYWGAITHAQWALFGLIHFTGQGHVTLIRNRSWSKCCPEFSTQKHESSEQHLFIFHMSPSFCSEPEPKSVLLRN